MSLVDGRKFGFSLSDTRSRRSFVVVCSALELMAWFLFGIVLFYGQTSFGRLYMPMILVLSFALFLIPRIFFGGVTKGGAVLYFQNRQIRNQITDVITSQSVLASRPKLREKVARYLDSFYDLDRHDRDVRDSAHYRAYKMLRRITSCIPYAYIFVLLLGNEVWFRLFLDLLFLALILAQSLPQMIILWSEEPDVAVQDGSLPTAS